MKLNYRILIIFTFLVNNLAQSQDIDYNKIIIPVSIEPSSFDEKLVQLAWKNNPISSISKSDIKIAELDKVINDWSWLDNIYAVGNINEFTINPELQTGATNYPRYNFGVRVDLGMFVRIPKNSAISREQISILNNNKNENKLQMRSAVLSSYEDFKRSFKILHIRIKLVEDKLQMFDDFQNKFISGEIGLEKLTQVSQLYDTSIEAKVQAEYNLNSAKIRIESLIGINIEEVVGYNNEINSFVEEIR